MNARTANTLGIVSLVFWCMNVAVTRQLGEAHPFGMPGLSFFIGGVILVAWDTFRRRPPPWKSDAGPAFWLFGGFCYIVYMILYVVSLSTSSSREVVLPLGLINYMWPSLILLLMPLFFPGRVRWAILIAGIALCVIGVGFALLWGLSFRDIAGVMRNDWQAVVMMAIAAFLWALYSNIARKWGGTANGVGWFFLLTGLVLLALWVGSGEPLGFESAMLGPLLLHSVAISAVGYLLWDLGVRWGDMSLLGTLANFLPIGSSLFGAWYLGNSTTSGLWIGCVLVTVGAILCRRGFVKTS